MTRPFNDSASLFIGDLDKTVDDLDIQNFFSSKMEGQRFISCRVCRDHETHDSLGYGYLNFLSHADAKNALDTLNYMSLKPNLNPYRLMWSHHDPKFRRDTKLNIFIRNIPPGYSPKELHALAQEKGRDVFSVRVIPMGKTSIGYVQFLKAEDATSALDDLNKVEIVRYTIKDSKPQFVKAENAEAALKDLTVDSRESYHLQCQNYNVEKRHIFIDKLPLDTTDEELKTLCQDFGEIEKEKKDGAETDKIHIIKDSQGNVKGFAFVWFKTKEMADNCVKNLNDKQFKNSNLQVKIALTRGERIRYRQNLRFSNRKRNFFIKNVDDFTDDSLKKVFEAYGTVISCKIKRFPDIGETHKPAFAFCCYENDSSAKKMQEHLEEIELNHKIKVYAFKTLSEQQQENKSRRNVSDFQYSTAAGEEGRALPSRFYDQGGSNYRQGGNRPFTAPGGGGGGGGSGPRGPHRFGEEYNAGVESQMNQNFGGYPPHQGRGGGGQYFEQGGPNPHLGGGWGAVQGGPGGPGGPSSGFGAPGGAGMNLPGNPGGPAGAGGMPHMQQNFGSNYPSPTMTPQYPPGPTPQPQNAGPQQQQQQQQQMQQLMLQQQQQQRQQQPNVLPPFPAQQSQPPPPQALLAVQQPVAPGPQVGVPIPSPAGTQSITWEAIQRLPPEDQKQTIGELLYMQIVLQDQTNAGKITGMLLELPILDLFKMLQNQGELNTKIKEAQNVLQQSLTQG